MKMERIQMAGRGMVTDEITNRTEELFGRRMSVTEIRLMPYITFIAVNGGTIDARKINDKERAILNEWQDKKWIKIENKVKVVLTQDFWRKANEIVFMAYVNK